jgi:hypothetical protein
MEKIWAWLILITENLILAGNFFSKDPDGDPAYTLSENPENMVMPEAAAVSFKNLRRFGFISFMS